MPHGDVADGQLPIEDDGGLAKPDFVIHRIRALRLLPKATVEVDKLPVAVPGHHRAR